MSLRDFLFYKDIYILMLICIKEHNEKNKNTDNKAHRMTLQSYFSVKGYSEKDVNEATSALLDVGYLKTYNSNFSITEKGILFLEDYNLRKIDPLFTRFCKFIKRNLTEILSVMFSMTALIVSIIGLYHK
jgi:hypothetical protein